METFEFEDAEGFQYQFSLDRNRDGRRVLALYMRLRNARVWNPVIELDTDFQPYYKDAETDIPPPGTRDD